MEERKILTASIKEMQAFRDQLIARKTAPRNRRISSISSLYKYLVAAAAEIQLPVTVPNPTHAQFIARGSTDPREETKALSATGARALMGMLVDDSVLDYRDRAVLKFFLCSGARLSTACRH